MLERKFSNCEVRFKIGKERRKLNLHRRIKIVKTLGLSKIIYNIIIIYNTSVLEILQRNKQTNFQFSMGRKTGQN